MQSLGLSSVPMTADTALRGYHTFGTQIDRHASHASDDWSSEDDTSEDDVEKGRSQLTGGPDGGLSDPPSYQPPKDVFTGRLCVYRHLNVTKLYAYMKGFRRNQRGFCAFFNFVVYLAVYFALLSLQFNSKSLGDQARGLRLVTALSYPFEKVFNAESYWHEVERLSEAWFSVPWEGNGTAGYRVQAPPRLLAPPCPCKAALYGESLLTVRLRPSHVICCASCCGGRLVC